MKKNDRQTEQLQNAFADELRAEGISFMGYGVLPKFVMLDSDLTLEAKAIYAYFCSYTGRGSTAFPGRARIVDDLGINKDTYYRHYNLLLHEGYLTVAQQRSETGFYRNIYTLVSSPEKFRAAAPAHLQKTYAAISVSGLKAAGYGFIPRAVMTDQRLSLKAKGLYAYFCAFTGAGESAHPSLASVKQHLGISRTLYAKYTAELKALNYVEISQRISAGGRFGVNDVTVVDAPDLANSSTLHRFSREESASPCVDFSDTDNSDTGISDAEKSGTEKTDIKQSQHLKKNNSRQKQSLHQQQTAPEAAGERGSEQKETLSVGQTLWDEQRIPPEWLGKRERISEALQVLTDYDRRIAENGGIADNGSTYLLFLEALTDMLCAAGTMELTGDRITAHDVAKRLERFLRRSYAVGALRLYDLEEIAAESYEEGCRSRSIRSPLGYCKACIWTALKIGDAAVRAQLAHDGF